MTSRPFHHGNLRAVLLEQAEEMLRNTGVDGLSLRELARQAGVSHGAPRSHFIDRQALLDALAEQGFVRLTENIRSALAGRGSFEERFRRVGRAYVDFGVEDAALMELMFAAKLNDPSKALQDAASRLFETLDEAIPADPGSGDPSATDGSHIDRGSARVRFKLLFAATMQGTATLITSRRIARSEGDAIIDDAASALLGSELGRQLMSRPR
ncbi:TetR/AcrR family transcriptional regulator [Subtercola boreus]|uniref:TetR family transcriptional regulator n=1 Tax=Subtercola boreus TaxID=120213 RepID=A0A3E0W7V1_9MICO|nr:TetR/AcrR family transcriptional regulator [Subtercola boreus]RFA18101.1 TetR family transcriptional regulator [Subtercola boreus]RFA18483.1 TetR family transcriptional regulator [Subtercola boreus]RFA25011.1 TetR family transcriptional regulator [Subtercola boreus]